MKKILIVGGSFFSGNRGVNALTRSAVNILSDMYPEKITIKILSYSVKGNQETEFICLNRKITVKEVPFRLKDNLMVSCFSWAHKLFGKSIIPGFLKKTVALFNVLNEPDIILDLSAGDSFTDIYGLKRFIMITLPKLSAINMGKELILLPQTIGPFKWKLTRGISRYIANNTKLNYVRDMVSYRFLTDDLKISSAKTKYSPDLAFYMKPKADISIYDAVNSDIDRSELLVGVNISALMYYGGYSGKNQFNLVTDYKDLMLEVIKYFVNKNCKVILVPHVICSEPVVEDDFKLCRNIYENLKYCHPGKIFTFGRPYREDEIKNVIGQCDFFVGSRMHACIGAISMRVPTVPIAYSRKFYGIWNEYGMGKYVADPRHLNKADILEIVDSCFNSRALIRDEIDRRLFNIDSDIRNSLHEIVN